jgi:hypothetical protein
LASVALSSAKSFARILPPGGGGGATRLGGRGGAPDAGRTTVRQIRITFCAFLTLFSKFIVILERSSLELSFTRLPSIVLVTRSPSFFALFLRSLYCIY